MSTKTVLVIVNTKPQIFALGTVEELFKYELKENGVVISQVSSASPGATFPLVPAGTYSMVVTKNGVVASQSFTVVATDTTINVPDTLTLTFS